MFKMELKYNNSVREKLIELDSRYDEIIDKKMIPLLKSLYPDLNSNEFTKIDKETMEEKRLDMLSGMMWEAYDFTMEKYKLFDDLNKFNIIFLDWE